MEREVAWWLLWSGPWVSPICRGHGSPLAFKWVPLQEDLPHPSSHLLPRSAVYVQKPGPSHLNLGQLLRAVPGPECSRSLASASTVTASQPSFSPCHSGVPSFLTTQAQGWRHRVTKKNLQARSAGVTRGAGGHFLGCHTGP